MEGLNPEGDGPSGAAKRPTKDVRCSSCSATYKVSKSERKAFICATCGAIVDTDPWMKMARALA